MCHDNDLFCFRVGREIAGGRLKSPKHETTVLELHHPITQTIVDWLALEWFEVPVHIYLDSKNRWVSTFIPDESIVEDTDWVQQIELETGVPIDKADADTEISEVDAFKFPMLEGDQGLRQENYAG